MIPEYYICAKAGTQLRSRVRAVLHLRSNSEILADSTSSTPPVGDAAAALTLISVDSDAFLAFLINRKVSKDEGVKCPAVLATR